MMGCPRFNEETYGGGVDMTKNRMTTAFCALVMLSLVAGARADWQDEPAWHHSGLASQDGGIWDFELADLVDTHLATPGYFDMKFMFGTCFSGGFINDLSVFDNIAIGTACDWDVPASCEYLPTDSYDTRWTEWMSVNGEFATQSLAHDTGASYAPGDNPQCFWNPPGMADAKLDDGLSLHAILYVGEWEDDIEQDAFLDLTEMMYDSLVSEYGYDPLDIHVLFGDRPDLAPGLNTYSATYDDLEFAFSEISQNMNPYEEFFFWASDHGTWIPEPATLPLLALTGLLLARRRWCCMR
jgi:hypothetical protein